VEVLIRHIMDRDQVDYEKAQEKFEVIAAKNREYMFALSLPYQIAVALAVTGGILSFPLVFNLQTAQWFNEIFVTTEVPESADLETVLEVGSWTWQWMEPPLGQLSFFLLTMQYARSQIQNMGMKPYTSRMKHWRAQRLAKAFPQYDEHVLMSYSETCPIYHDGTSQ
jgi:hypothetical protein